MSTFRAACVQVNASDDMAANLRAVAELARRARAEGAEFISTPENVSMMTVGSANLRAKAAPEADHPALAAFRELARETGAWLLAGSLHVRLEDEDRLANRSYLLSPTGEVRAKYDKIHMFDVDLPSGESYRESKNFRPGAQAVLAELPWCRLGMTVCYDLRFPQLYRALAKAGADVLTIPSAFTRPTGRAHWHALMRARAIETGCYVVAAAQCGEHPGGRKTYGHSLIVAPWGEIVAEAGEEPGVIVADVDLARVAEARRQVPSLTHDREFAGPMLRDRLSAAAE
jgi:deaminated glutathione amidase